ncbi:MAG: tetratricopeptide repeat protein [Bacteroidales bacterium]
MKKVALFLVLVTSITIAFGQKNVRQTASNYLKDGKLDKAMEAINICVLDASTAQDTKAWFIRGNVYMAIANSTDEKFSKLDADPLAKALESYKKTVDLDTKKEYYDEILMKLDGKYRSFFDTAVAKYNGKNFKDAMINFGKAADMLVAVNITDSISLQYAGMCATKANEKEAAKGFYMRLLNGNMKSPTVYSSLSDIYLNEKDSASALKIIREGRKVYPNNLVLILAESDVYNYFNDVDKAIATLTLASKKDSTNHLVFMALGSNYQKIYEDTVKPAQMRNDSYLNAEKAYKKAIELKPDFSEAYFNFASLYFNAAVPLAIKANGLPLEQKEQYAKLTADANKMYALALPHLKKFDELQPNDLTTLNLLRQIYSSFDDKENLKAIQKKISDLRK